MKKWLDDSEERKVNEQISARLFNYMEKKLGFKKGGLKKIGLEDDLEALCDTLVKEMHSELDKCVKKQIEPVTIPSNIKNDYLTWDFILFLIVIGTAIWFKDFIFEKISKIFANTGILSIIIISVLFIIFLFVSFLIIRIQGGDSKND